MIRAILFDLDDTLFDRAAAHRRYCLDLMARRSEIFASDRHEVDLHTLLGPYDRDRHAFARRVARAFPRLGSPLALADDHARRLATFIEIDPSVVRLVAHLSQDYRLGVVSNGHGPVQRAKLVAAGVSDLCEHVLISGEEGVSKPHPALFRKALSRVLTAPHEALFVGDDPSADIAGAARVGMRTCWVSGARAYPAGIQPPELTIESVCQLPGVLR